MKVRTIAKTSFLITVLVIMYSVMFAIEAGRRGL